MKRSGRLLILVWLASFSCIDQKEYQINSLQVNPSVAVPVAFGTLGLQDLLKKVDSLNVKVDANDVVYLEYNNQLTSQDIRDLISLPDKVVNQSINVLAGTIPAHSTKDIHHDSVNVIVDLGLVPEQLSQIDFKTGSIDYSSNWLPSNGVPSYEVQITSADFVSRTTGKNLSIVTSTSGSIPLSDYKLNLVKNKFTLKMVMVLKKTASSTVIKPNTSVSVNFSMLGMDFQSIFGFFGDQTAFPPADSINIGAFGTALLPANVSFAQPVITLTVVNDYGIPCKVTFVKLEARKNGTVLPLQINPTSPVTINVPPSLGTSASTPVTVTNTKQVIDFSPSQIYYKTSARINQGLVSGNNFMADTSKMRVMMGLNVPVYGRATGITLRDTAKIDLSKENQSQVQKASLKITAINQLPLDANIQIYLADANNLITDSLFDASQTQLIKGSTVTATGDLESAGVMDKTISLGSDKLTKIFNTKALIIVAVLSTSKDAQGNTVDVKFKSQYTLQVKVGLLTDLNFNVKL